MEANPIIFVGQDFAFVDGHTHATGCVEDQVFDAGALPKDYFHVPGVGGRPVVTNRIYHSYHLFMQNYLVDFAKLKPMIRHINTSTVGARVQGMEEMGLEAALASTSSPTRGSPSAIIAESHGANQEATPERQKAVLKAWEAELSRLLSDVSLEDSFERLFAKFKRTSLPPLGGRSYDDIWYLYEVKYRSESDAIRLAFLNRFREHLRFAYEEVLEMEGAV
jgi:hypothetical protein